VSGGWGEGLTHFLGVSVCCEVRRRDEERGDDGQEEEEEVVVVSGTFFANTWSTQQHTRDAQGEK